MSFFKGLVPKRTLVGIQLKSLRSQPVFRAQTPMYICVCVYVYSQYVHSYHTTTSNRISAALEYLHVKNKSGQRQQTADTTRLVFILGFFQGFVSTALTFLHNPHSLSGRMIYSPAGGLQQSKLSAETRQNCVFCYARPRTLHHNCRCSMGMGLH